MRLSRIHLVLVLCSVVLLITTLIALRTPEPTLERVRRRGVIQVGYASEQPFAYRDAVGTVTGESAEIARAMLTRLDIPRIEWVQTEWSELIPELNAGRFDLIAIGMFVTCERAQAVAFTEPIFSLEQAFLVRAGNPRQLRAYADVARRPDVRLAVLTGAQEQVLAQASGIEAHQLLTVPDAQTGLVAVLDGQADALALTRLSIVALVAQAPSGSVELATPFAQPQLPGLPARGYAAFGLRHEDTTLREALNAQLRGFIGTPDHQQLVAPFGFTSAELPGTVTTEALLSACGPSTP